MSFTKQVHVVTGDDYLTQKMKDYLFTEHKAVHVRTKCACGGCDNYIDVYDFDVNSKCNDEMLGALQVLTEHGKGRIRMTITVHEMGIEENVINYE